MVYSTLDIFTTIVSTWDSQVKLIIGTHTPSWYLAAALTKLSMATPEECSCKNQENGQVWPVAITTRVTTRVPSLHSTVKKHDVSYSVGGSCT